MNIHSRARTTPLGRAELVKRVLDGGWTVADAAASMGVSRRTGYKWLARFRSEGAAGLQDRRSVPQQMPRMTSAERADVIVLMRHCRMSSTAIAQQLAMPRSTVARVLQRAGLSRLSTPSQASVVRYERAQPGDLVHLDTKKLGRIVRVGHRITGDRRIRARGAGWEYVHVAIDDASRAVHMEVLDDESGASCAAFLRRAVAHFRHIGFETRQILTDNGTGYRSHIFAFECQQLQLQHLRTQPYRPCTNGKAERVIQTMLREWAYARAYRSSRERTQALSPWLNYYNRWRPHGSLEGRPPFSRIPTAVNNVSGTYT